jgi:hypothetical protein
LQVKPILAGGQFITIPTVSGLIAVGEVCGSTAERAGKPESVSSRMMICNSTGKAWTLGNDIKGYNNLNNVNGFEGNNSIIQDTYLFYLNCFISGFVTAN